MKHPHFLQRLALQVGYPADSLSYWSPRDPRGGRWGRGILSGRGFTSPPHFVFPPLPRERGLRNAKGVRFFAHQAHRTNDNPLWFLPLCLFSLRSWRPRGPSEGGLCGSILFSFFLPLPHRNLALIYLSPCREVFIIFTVSGYSPRGSIHKRQTKIGWHQ